MNNFDIDAVRYLLNSFAVLFMEPSGFKRDIPIDLQNIVWLFFITARPPPIKGEFLLSMILRILLIISSLSKFRTLFIEIVYINKNKIMLRYFDILFYIFIKYLIYIFLLIIFLR